MLSEILVKSSAIASAVIPPPTGAQPDTSIDRDHVNSSQAQSGSGMYRVTNFSSHINEQTVDATQSLLGDAMNDQSIKAQLLRPYIKSLIGDALVEQQLKTASHVNRAYQIQPTEQHSAPVSKAHEAPDRLDGEVAKSLDPIRNHRRRKNLVISRGQHIKTAFHRPWIGSVTVKSHSSVSKEWNDELQHYEIEKEGWETTIHLRLAPWLTDKAFDLRVDNFFATYTGARRSFTLEPVRYTHMPLAITQAITQGDLTSLKAMIARREIFLKDKSDDTEQNLLEMSIQAMTEEWFDVWRYGPSRYTTSIIDTCQWLLSQGLSFDNPDRYLLEAANIDRSEVFHDPVGYLQLMMLETEMPVGETDALFHKMTNLVMDSTANGSSIARAKTLTMFALDVESGLLLPDLETTIWDLVSEGATDEELKMLQIPESWTSMAERYPIFRDIVNCVLRTMLEFSSNGVSDKARTLTNDARCRTLAKTRQFLIRFMSFVPISESYARWATKPVTTLLRLCQPMGILKDGFAACMFRFACMHHILPIWNDILNDANFPAEDLLKEHVSNESRLQSPVKISLGHDRTEDPSSLTQRVTMLVEDPHKSFDLEPNYTVQDCWRSLYCSHVRETFPDSLFVPSWEPSEGYPDICQVRQDGNELIFDCDITNPVSPDSSDWEEEREYWNRFQADAESFYKIDIKEPSPAETDGPAETQQTGLLPRLISGGLTFVSGIV